MKKNVLVCIILVFVTCAYSSEPLADVSSVVFTGDASVAYGIDLNSGYSGFMNETNVLLQLNLLPTDMLHVTRGYAVWGELALKLDGDLMFEADGPSGITPQLQNDSVIVDKAVIHIYDAYVGLEEGDFDFGDEFDFPNVLGFDNEDTVNGEGIFYEEDRPSQVFGYRHGFTAGYVHEIFSVEASLRTKLEYTALDPSSVTKDKNESLTESKLIPYVEGVVCTDVSDIPFPIVNGKWVIPPDTVYRIYMVDSESANAWTNDYAVGLYSTVSPLDNLLFGLGGAYAFSGIRQGDFSVFSAAQYTVDFGQFSLFPVITYNLFGDFDEGIDVLSFTQNELGFGLNFGWGDAMEGDSLLYDFYDEKLAYVGTPDSNDDEGDGTILPGVSVFTSLDFLPEGFTKKIPFLVMLHTGELVPQLSAQLMFSTNFATGAKTVLWNEGQNSAETAMEGSLNKLASQAALAIDYDIFAGDLVITPAIGTLVGYAASENEGDSTFGMSVLPIVNVQLAGLIPNTTFAIRWDEFSFSTGKSTVKNVEEVIQTINNGVLTLKAEITL